LVVWRVRPGCLSRDGQTETLGAGAVAKVARAVQKRILSGALKPPRKRD
jgi:hypothetical protein